MVEYVTFQYVTQVPGVNTLTTFGEYPSTLNAYNNGLNSRYNLGTKSITKLSPVKISPFSNESSSEAIPLYNNNVSIPQSPIINTTDFQLSSPILNTGTNLVNLQNNNLGQYQISNNIYNTGFTTLIPSINILPSPYSGLNDLNAINTANLSSYPIYSMNSNNLMVVPNQSLAYDNNNLYITDVSPINTYYLQPTPQLVNDDYSTNNIGLINSSPYNYSAVPLQQVPVLIHPGVPLADYNISNNNQIAQNYITGLTSTDPYDVNFINNYNAQVQNINLLNSNPITGYEQPLNGYQINYVPNVNLNSNYKLESYEPDVNIKSSIEISSTDLNQNMNINHYDSFKNNYISEPLSETQNLINLNNNGVENKNIYSYKYSEPISSLPNINSLNEINYNFNEIPEDTPFPMGNIKSDYSVRSKKPYLKQVNKNITLPPITIMPISEEDSIPLERRGYVTRTKAKVFDPTKNTVTNLKVKKISFPSKKAIDVQSTNRIESATTVLSQRKSLTNETKESFDFPLNSSYKKTTHQVGIGPKSPLRIYGINHTVGDPLSQSRFNIKSVEVSSPLSNSKQYEKENIQPPSNIIYPPRKNHINSHNE